MWICRRLTSRKPVCRTEKKLILLKVSTSIKPGGGGEVWETQKVDKRNLIQDPNVRPLGFNLKRKARFAQNRFRTGYGVNR